MAQAARRHQFDTDLLAGGIIAGTRTESLIGLNCTPGGGKTASATLLAHRLLDAGIIDAVLWVVPRLPLADQVQVAFTSGFGSRSSRRLEVVDGQDDLFPPTLPNSVKTVGCITTYSAIAHGKNWDRFQKAVSARRCLMILDEVQFLNDDLPESLGGDMARGWYARVKQVQQVATYCLVMSGTLWRTDGKRLPFVPYEKRADGKWYPLCDINYSLREAVAERAILPMEWRNRPATVEYIHDGETQIHDLLDDGDDEESRKVRAFLAGENAVRGLLDDMVRDWREWCIHGYNSRMLVIADNTREARRWRDYLQSHHQLSCVLATSREEAANRKLNHFRERRQGQCLITVAMAYIGFDCPDLTHLAYLSAIRAPSWMLQSFARVSRYDANAPIGYDSQLACIYSPDDERIRRFCDWIRSEQEIGIASRRQAGNGECANKQPDEFLAVLKPEEFTPVNATLDRGRSIESLYRRISPAIEAQLDAFVQSSPFASQVAKSVLYEILLKENPEKWAPKQETNCVK